jgi:hypothetical protein
VSCRCYELVFDAVVGAIDVDFIAVTVTVAVVDVDAAADDSVVVDTIPGSSGALDV